MAKKKEIKEQTFRFGVAGLFMLNPTSKLKGYDKFLHEKGGADLFTAFYPHIQAWSFEPFIGKDRADRGLRIGDKTVYFEVDRCTEGPKVINQKLESYMNHADRTGERFYVVFSLLETDEKVALRGENLIHLFASKKRGNQFLAANHNNLLISPMGEVLYSPKDGALSLNTLE